nr:hypothetical protein [Oxalobacteraceae bacterium]
MIRVARVSASVDADADRRSLVKKVSKKTSQAGKASIEFGLRLIDDNASERKQKVSRNIRSTFPSLR